MIQDVSLIAAGNNDRRVGLLDKRRPQERAPGDPVPLGVPAAAKRTPNRPRRVAGPKFVLGATL